MTQYLQDGRRPLSAWAGYDAEIAKLESAQDWSNILTAAIGSGVPLEIPPNPSLASGHYPVRSLSTVTSPIATRGLIHVQTFKTIDIHFTGGASIKPMGSTATTHQGAVLTLVSSKYGDAANARITEICNIDGLAIDMSDVDGDDRGLNGLDITAYYGARITNPRVYTTNAITASAQNIGVGGGDSGITTHKCRETTVLNPVMIGLFDVGIYISGDDSYTTTNDAIGPDGEGEGVTVIGGYFFRCGVAISGKRDHWGVTVVGSRMVECGIGIHGGIVDSKPNHGKGWTITGVRMNKMQGRPIWLNGGYGDVVQGNHIWDFALTIYDQAWTNVVNFNPIAAIEMHGCQNAVVSNNTIGMNEWTYPVSAPPGTTREPCAIWAADLERYTLADTPTTGCLFTNNRFVGIYAGILETGAANDNLFDNKMSGNILADRRLGAATRITSYATGTFTPTLAGSTSPATAYAARTVTYTKVDNLLTVMGYIQLSSAAGLSGNVTIDLSSLPYTPRNDLGQYPVTLALQDVTHSSTTYTDFIGLIVQGTKNVILRESSGGAYLALTHGAFAASRLTFQFTVPVA